MHCLTNDFGKIKPPAGSKIDWGHPISQRMYCAYLFSEKGGTKVYDACDRAGVMSFVQNGAMPLWTARGLQCGNGKGYVENNATVKSAENPCLADFTVRIRHVPRTWPGTYTVPIDTDTSRYISIFMNGSTINFSGGGGRSGSSVQPAGELSDFVWVRKLRSGTGTHYYYRNGNLTSSESGDTNTSWSTSAGHRMSLGGNPSGGGSLYDGEYHLVEIWMRALQVPEIEELWQDPYVNVDTGKLRLWSIPIGAIVANAGSFPLVNTSAPTAASTSGGAFNFTYIAGFDAISSTAEIGNYLNFGTVSGVSLNTNTAHTPFNTGQSLVSTSNTFKLAYTLPATTASIIVGLYFKNKTSGTLSGTIIQFLEGGSNQLWLGFQSGNTGKLEIRRGGSGGTLLGTTASAVITDLTFAHIELKVKISDSIASGDVVLYVDGTSVLTLSAATDTQSTANAYADVVQIGNGDIACYIDDFFVVDWSIGGSGQVGVCRIYYLTPNGAGATNNFTASGGGGSGTNYQMVDETPNSTSDYNSDSTPGDIDLYDYLNFTSQPSSVKVLQLNNLIAIMDAGPRTVRGLVRVSGSNYEGSDMYPTPSYRFHSTIFLANPATNVPWTYSDVNVVQAGLKIQA